MCGEISPVHALNTNLLVVYLQPLEVHGGGLIVLLGFIQALDSAGVCRNFLQNTFIDPVLQFLFGGDVIHVVVTEGTLELIVKCVREAKDIPLVRDFLIIKGYIQPFFPYVYVAV